MSEKWELVYKGSVKDVYRGASKDVYYFSFSDRYSVFDWGEMPDQLSLKGESLAVMGDLFFRILKSKGFRHHSLGLTDADGKILPIGSRSNMLAVQSVDRRMPGPNRDYSYYRNEKPINTLVPLEVVFRFGIPAGSSLLKRLEKNSNYARELGLPAVPKEGDFFSEPVVEFFTKLESTDRFLTEKEAQDVAGLSGLELAALKKITKDIAKNLYGIFQKMEVELWDGKFEFSFIAEQDGLRSLQLVDSVGPDELRLIYEGVHLSKEVLRKQYRNSAWYEAVEKSKKLAEERGTDDWKRICKEELQSFPLPLPNRVRRAVTHLYPAIANALALTSGLSSKAIFENVPDLKTVARELKQL